jgi:cytochrome c2/uncharacterized coiled-coil protein SlyX
MKTNTGLIAGLVVSVLLAAVFAVLWYGAYEDNKLLTRKVNYLTHQLEGNFSLLQKIAQQLAETQKQLQDTQNQLRETQERLQDTSNQLKDTQARLAETQKQLQAVQNQLEQTQNRLKETQEQLRDTQNQLKDAQAQLSEVKAQLALLKTLMSSIISTTTAPTTGIKYDPQLAGKGRQYFSEIGCTACHSIKSLGISGGAVGPDLSKVLLGNPGAGGSVIGKFFKEKGLDNPAADPEKAAELLKEYLTNPPQYSTTMKTQVRAYKATYSNWATDQVPALVELLKEAAAKASR